ncbi:hypothetical protein EA58_14815 [Photobacterium galatheae]|uniref:Uncharacterized protein n=1 Tax=Photobacterium galatheae TaxID=1654360 RepID=A0A066RKZ7_9GAMM|nr:hypothetical protein EA58_14815 [Photobacterium galatheae]
MAVRCVQFFLDVSETIPDQITISSNGKEETLKVDKFLTRHTRTKDLVAALSKAGLDVNRDTDERTLLKLARYKGLDNHKINTNEVFVVKHMTPKKY